MAKLDISYLEALLQKGLDFTIKLVNESVPGLNKCVVGFLVFNSRQNIWTVAFQTKKKGKVCFADERTSYTEAAELAVKKTQAYLNDGYRFVSISSGYDSSVKC